MAKAIRLTINVYEKKHSRYNRWRGKRSWYFALKAQAWFGKHLNKDKYNVFKVVIEGNDWYVERDNPVRLKVDKNDFSFTVEGHKISFDAVFVAIHGTPAEDGKLQGYFDMLRISYNCCGVLQAALTFDKQRCKEYLTQFGVKTGKAVLLKKADREEAEQKVLQTLSLPLFVKPNKNGSSYGASKVTEQGELATAIKNAFDFDDEILVEYPAGH